MDLELEKSNSNFTLRRVPRHIHYVTNTDSTKCYILREYIEDDEFCCTYVKTERSCSAMVRVFDYLDFFVCKLRLQKTFWNAAAMMAITMLILLIYTLILYVMCKYFLVPNFIAIAKSLRTTRFGYGVVVIAPLLCTPDVYDEITRSCATDEEYGSVLLAQVFGKVLALFCTGMALLAFKRIYTLTAWYAVSSLALAMILLTYLKEIVDFELSSTRMYQIHAGVNIGLYFVFLLLTIFSVARRKHLSRVTVISTGMIRVFEFEMLTFDNVCAQFLFAINPMKHLTSKYTVIKVILAPFWLLLAILMPAIDRRQPIMGWSKPLAVISLLLSPLIFGFYTELQKYLMIYVFFFFAAPAAICTVCFTVTEDGPSFQYIYAIFGVFIAICIYDIVDSEIDTLIWQVFTFLFGFDTDSLVALVNPLSYCMMEWIVLWALIDREYTQMAYGTIIGIIMFHCFCTLPSLVFKPCFDYTHDVSLTANTYTTYVFLMIIFSYTLVNMMLTNFQLRLSFGIYILTMYGVHFLYTVLSAFHVIHSYGTKHSISTKKYSEVDWA